MYITKKFKENVYYEKATHDIQIFCTKISIFLIPFFHELLKNSGIWQTNFFRTKGKVSDQ